MLSCISLNRSDDSREIIGMNIHFSIKNIRTSCCTKQAPPWHSSMGVLLLQHWPSVHVVSDKVARFKSPVSDCDDNRLWPAWPVGRYRPGWCGMLYLVTWRYPLPSITLQHNIHQPEQISIRNPAGPRTTPLKPGTAPHHIFIFLSASTLWIHPSA